nr:FAD/NAD(P)-binding oxidoreductase family protein [Tanacetum cinerariifolium]
RPTGVELAGEIVVDYLNKKITLVHKGYGLQNFLRVKAFNKTLDWLQSKHVEVKLEKTINLEDVADGKLGSLTKLPDEDFPYTKQLHDCMGATLVALGHETFLKQLKDLHVKYQVFNSFCADVTMKFIMSLSSSLLVYHGFSNVLMERLHDTFGENSLEPIGDLEAMAINGDDTHAMETNKENGGSERNAGTRYIIEEKEQWCLSTLGYFKGFLRQYASE